jgi:hypothetical protein
VLSRTHGTEFSWGDSTAGGLEGHHDIVEEDALMAFALIPSVRTNVPDTKPSAGDTKPAAGDTKPAAADTKPSGKARKNKHKKRKKRLKKAANALKALDVMKAGGEEKPLAAEASICTSTAIAGIEDGALEDEAIYEGCKVSGDEVMHEGENHSVESGSTETNERLRAAAPVPRSEAEVDGLGELNESVVATARKGASKRSRRSSKRRTKKASKRLIAVAPVDMSHEEVDTG